uniref:type II toxin-antitoxin system Phd/YefM family antitoxin n=1 Tax=Ningiella ruwaisensis TaxID=2364274 RepID=UPI00109F7DD2|nr:type II toxin-antitoxin system Phd/YefM family antitoxin [Ningiella ruwaisensis]
MKTTTVTYLKENANNLGVEEPLMITKNGKPAYVIQSASDYNYQQDRLALLKLLMLSEKSGKEKGYLLHEEVFKRNEQG